MNGMALTRAVPLGDGAAEHLLLGTTSPAQADGNLLPVLWAHSVCDPGSPERRISVSLGPASSG